MTRPGGRCCETCGQDGLALALEDAASELERIAGRGRELLGEQPGPDTSALDDMVRDIEELASQLQGDLMEAGR